MTEKVIGRLDVIELEAVRDQGLQIDAVRRDNLHQSAHPLRSPGAQCRYDLVVAETGGECIERDPEIAGINAKAGQRSARAEHAKASFERRLCTQSLDRDIDTASLRYAHDLGDR